MASELHKGTKAILGFGFVGLLATVSVVWWAKSDSGMIDVSATIAESNQAAVAQGGSASDMVQPPSQFANMVNGGLVPQSGGNETATEPPQTPLSEVPPEGNATSTDANTATSTEAEGSGDGEQNTSNSDTPVSSSDTGESDTPSDQASAQGTE